VHPWSSKPLLATGLVVTLLTPVPARAQQCLLQPMSAAASSDPWVVREVPSNWLRDALRLPEDRVPRLGLRSTESELYGPRGDQPYDLEKTTNVGRLQAEVYFQLAQRAARRDVASTMFVRSPDWFWTYVQAAGVDSATAPPSARNSLAHNQGMQLDIRTDRVIKKVKKGPEPVLAMNVRTWWPEEDGRSRYTYQDTLTEPSIQVTSKRVITYRLVDFGDMVVYDKIEGSSGKPLEGFLSFLFDTFGEANLKQSRMALSDDGLLVVRGTGKWLVKKSKTFVVYPDGSVGGLPEDRPDLHEIQARLEQDLDIEYHDYDWGCETRLAPATLTIADDETAYEGGR
jgi:hypothetical protein